MAWDDPVVWILIVGVVILLFGSNKIPQLARSLGAARKEFDNARKGFMGAMNSEINSASNAPVSTPAKPPGLTNPGVVAAPQQPQPPSIPQNSNVQPVLGEAPQQEDDPLLLAARNEGIDTRGKTRSAIAAELASKLKD